MSKPIWMIQYKTSDKTLQKRLSDFCQNRMLSTLSFTNNASCEQLRSLPTNSLFILIQPSDSWILGYIIGDPAKSKDIQKKINRHFVPVIETKYSDVPFTARTGIFLPHGEFVKMFDGQDLENLEERILKPVFHCTLDDLPELILTAYRARKARKHHHEVFNWDTSLGSDKSRGIEPSRRQLKQRQDALAGRRRLPGAGFSRG